ncbi:PEP-CTERM sorting domain-containing protein [Leptolyngbya sp. 15MV]|nr:PEP-CTERM sorting domain-containing protein [Leptolyngbya sp. 15MV]
MKKIMALSVLALASAANAQALFNGSPIVQNFDTLPSQGTVPALSATTGLQISLNTHLSVTSLDGWQVAKIGGSGTSPMPFAVDAGSNISGGIFSYGAVGSSERALGSLASGSNVPAFGVWIQNSAAFSITEFTVSFDAEAWRSSTSQVNTLAFAWGTSGGTITSANFLSDATLTAFAAGDIVGPAPVTSNGPLNPPTVTSVSFTVTGLNVAPGESIFLRWQDVNETGNDAGLAIDNFNFSAVPTPGTMALLGMGGLVAARRRRA